MGKNKEKYPTVYAITHKVVYLLLIHVKFVKIGLHREVNRPSAIPGLHHPQTPYFTLNSFQPKNSVGITLVQLQIQDGRQKTNNPEYLEKSD